ncbi:MAG: glycosyltransferase family 9 protein [Nanoarchaeota archaeon]
MKILVIKLGAKGDVVRTLPVLIALKNKYPDSETTWITKKESLDIVKSSPYVNSVYSIPVYVNAKFDILYNFDIEKQASDIAIKTKADKKFGFYCKGDYPASFNPSSEYYLNTLFDDELKKTNKKTYQQMMFEAAELPYNKEHHSLYLDEKDKNYARDFIENNKINIDRLIGIHLGASSRWPSKTWHEDKIKEFIIKAKQRDYEILLFGGPNEADKHTRLSEELEKQGIEIYRNNPYNSDKEFISLVNICRYMICSDSFSLHVALALKKPTIGLFFCTPPDEVEDYGVLRKIVSPMLYEFFPEKMDQYSEELVKSISADEVLNAIGEMDNQFL